MKLFQNCWVSRKELKGQNIILLATLCGLKLKRKVLERFTMVKTFCCHVGWKEEGVLSYLCSVLGLGLANF